MPRKENRGSKSGSRDGLKSKHQHNRAGSHGKRGNPVPLDHDNEVPLKQETTKKEHRSYRPDKEPTFNSASDSSIDSTDIKNGEEDTLGDGSENSGEGIEEENNSDVSEQSDESTKESIGKEDDSSSFNLIDSSGEADNRDEADIGSAIINQRVKIRLLMQIRSEIQTAVSEINRLPYDNELVQMYRDDAEIDNLYGELEKELVAFAEDISTFKEPEFAGQTPSLRNTVSETKNEIASKESVECPPSSSNELGAVKKQDGASVECPIIALTTPIPEIQRIIREAQPSIFPGSGPGNMSGRGRGGNTNNAMFSSHFSTWVRIERVLSDKHRMRTRTMINRRGVVPLGDRMELWKIVSSNLQPSVNDVVLFKSREKKEEKVENEIDSSEVKRRELAKASVESPQPEQTSSYIFDDTDFLALIIQDLMGPYSAIELDTQRSSQISSLVHPIFGLGVYSKDVKFGKTPFLHAVKDKVIRLDVHEDIVGFCEPVVYPFEQEPTTSGLFSMIFGSASTSSEQDKEDKSHGTIDGKNDN